MLWFLASYWTTQTPVRMPSLKEWSSFTVVNFIVLMLEER